MSVRTMRAQIASAINVVVQLERMSDGRRRMVSLYEITGMEGDIITMQELFQFRRESTDDRGVIHGNYWATGLRSKFVTTLATRGIHLPRELFSPDRPLG